MSATTAHAPDAAHHPDPQHALTLIDLLLRDRKAFLLRIHAGHDLPAIARTMLLTAAIAAALFGASLGFYRGGVQILYAALKLPMVILFTAAICTPASIALRKIITGRVDPQRDIALTLASLALTTLFMAAAAPVLLLAVLLHIDYHPLILLTTAACAAGGLAGITLYFGGLQGERLTHRFAFGAALLLLAALVGSQMSWTLRPYIVRPRTEDIPFTRALEGSLLEAVAISLRSSLGIYDLEPYENLDADADATYEPAELRRRR